jgi:hypothetical protein
MIKQQGYICPACGGTGFMLVATRRGHQIEEHYQGCLQCHGVGSLCVHTLTATRLRQDEHHGLGSRH